MEFIRIGVKFRFSNHKFVKLKSKIMENEKLRRQSGAPYYEHQDSQTVGERGPVLLQDFILQENLAHFVRERIPERVVHAKGTGAYG